jgi:formylglycine-generating enzyme required for sulfatase activity
MEKIALLIGVSEYEHAMGLKPLPAAVKDVEAMQRVLANPEMGGFAEADITMLKNPQRQKMEDAIYELFSERQKEDLLLLYFSGHGITDENGRLYLSTRVTHKRNGSLVIPSAVAAGSLHDSMNRSRSQRQVIILDCCFSGAIAQGLTVKDDGTVNIKQQLGGKGRAILTSSSSTQYSFEQEGSELSIYTRYLVEGIEKGAADRDNDGSISVNELHEYASSKVQEAAPAMTPKFFPVEEGYKILLAKSPKDDPKLKYRKEVEDVACEDDGEISGINRDYLDELRSKLNVSVDDANTIESEVLAPFRQRQEKLRRYEQVLSRTVQQQSSLREKDRKALKRLQEVLNLRDEDVALIEERILGQPKATQVVQPAPTQKNKFKQFEFEVVRVNSQGQISDRTSHQAEFFTEDLGNGVLLEMVSIPGGEFLMGSPESELGRYDTESPQHTVTIQPFCMGKYPITQAQWQAVANFPKVEIDLNPDPSHFKGAKRPVEQVSWDDAVEFCARLSQKTGKPYRLPSESEWEYACRAGTTTPFHFGETITTDLANYRGTDWTYEGTVYPGNYGQGSKGEYREQTTDVGKFLPNVFGLYDMHGNIWEWCQDAWHDSYKNAPVDGTAWMEDNDNQIKLLRGGSWLRGPSSCRSAYRFSFSRGYRNRYVGVRVAVPVPRTL